MSSAEEYSLVWADMEARASATEYPPGVGMCGWCGGTGATDIDPSDGSVINACEQCGGSGAVPDLPDDIDEQGADW